MNIDLIGNGKIASSIIIVTFNSKISFRKILNSSNNKLIAKNLKKKFKKIIIVKNNQETVNNIHNRLGK